MFKGSEIDILARQVEDLQRQLAVLRKGDRLFARLPSAS
jgi:hypothetical protein